MTEQSSNELQTTGGHTLNTKSLLQPSWHINLNSCTYGAITLPACFSIAQHLKNDLMRQFDSQVNDFMDSLIEESASMEPAPLPAVFSPPLSDKERSKLRCCPLTYQHGQMYEVSALVDSLSSFLSWSYS